MANNITIKIASDVSSAVSGINQVNQKLDQLQATNEKTRKSLAAISAGFTAVTSAVGIVANAISVVVDLGKDLTNAYTLQEQAEIRLQSVLKATQNAVGMSAGEMLELADSLQKVTTYSDQEILAVEQMLAATRLIGRDIVPEATLAILDMAAAAGEDATGAAQRLAKALSNPAGEMESLKEAGIQLTEEQKRNIEKVQEQNGLYEAQKLLLQEVAGTYGGMATAIASTDTGKLEQLQNAWQDLKEGLGETLMSSLDGVVDFTLSLVEKIEGFVSEHNANRASWDSVYSALDSGATELGGFSDEQLERLINASAYRQYMAALPSDMDRQKYEDLGLRNGRFTENDRAAYLAAQTEMARRNQPISSASSIQTIQDEKAWLREQERLRREQEIEAQRAAQAAATGAADDFISSNTALSITAQEQAIQAKIDSANQVLADIESTGAEVSDTTLSIIEEIIAGLEEQKRNLREVEAEPTVDTSSILSAAQSFISANSGLSVSAQTEALNEKIWTSMQLSRDPGLSDEMKTQLEEITAALIEQRNALMEVEDATDSLTDRQQSAMKALESFESAQKYIEPIMSITTSIGDLFQNMADSASSALDEIEAKWDDYFDELDAKQERQSDSLNALLGAGKISYEDYISAQNAMDEERAEAERQKAEEEAEARDKANQFGEAAFAANQANAIAQVAIDTASAIMGAWADNPNPVVAGVMTGLITAASAAQIAAISSQQYTPLAAGGIVQSPTFALLGEGGNKEAVIPLTDSNMERAGFSRSQEGAIVINISVGASYTGDQLAKDVFRGIEMAQRTGALPKWKYA